MTFEFNTQPVACSSVDIDEIGNFGLEACNVNGYCYYLAVKCFFGTAVIATCGPIFPDVEMLPSGFSMSMLKIPADQAKLSKQINTFLNDKYKALTEARVIPFEEAINNFREIKDYLINLKEDTF